MADMDLEIVSVHNPRIKQWSQLLTKKGRDRQQKFLLEGVHLIQEALRASVSLEAVLYSMEKGVPEELRLALQGTGLERIAVSENVLAKVTDTQTPQAIVAIAHRTAVNPESLLDKSKDGLVVAVDGVQDPGNLGTIIRAADASGAVGVVLGTGTVDLYNPKTVRSTMGSMFHIPVIQSELRSLLTEAAAYGIQLVTTSLGARTSCYEADFTKPTWIIVGNEGEGVSEEIRSMASLEVIIPIRGQAESLNVAMATTVLLYEGLRQRELGKH